MCYIWKPYIQNLEQKSFLAIAGVLLVAGAAVSWATGAVDIWAAGAAVIWTAGVHHPY